MANGKRKGQGQAGGRRKTTTIHTDGQGPSKKVKKGDVDLPVVPVSAEKNESPAAAEPGSNEPDSFLNIAVENEEVDLVDNDKDVTIEFESNEPNPFLLNPVLKVMMSQMTIEDLKRSRGVCQLWDDYSTTELQKLKSQMKAQKFTKADQLEKFVNASKATPNNLFTSHKMETSLSIISAQDERFYQNVQPKSLTIERMYTYPYTNSALDILKILENSSQHIKEFRFTDYLDDRGQRKFDEKSTWSEDLKFPELEEITLKEFTSNIEWMKDFHFIIKNVINNSPKFKSLSLSEQSIDRQLCEHFTSCDLIGKLNELSISHKKYNGFTPDNVVPVIAQELVKMAQAGLKLSKFEISVNFNGHLIQEILLSQLGGLREFLTTQSDTLVNLNIEINIAKNNLLDAYIENGKLDMPPLPKLKVLEIGNTNADNYISYNLMDLPIILPNLKEITIHFNDNFCNLSEIFSGSLEDVKKMRIKHPKLITNKEAYKRYRQLEYYFPRVVEFEVDHTYACYRFGYNCTWNQQYKHIPWKKTLKKLTICSSLLEKLKFKSLSHLKGLRRLELVQDSDWHNHTDFNFESLSKTYVKSLKVHNYLIHEELLELIRSRFIFDYNPAKFSCLTRRIHY